MVKITNEELMDFNKWRNFLTTGNGTTRLPNLELIHVAPPGGRICNQYKRCYLVAKFTTNSSGATFWPNLYFVYLWQKNKKNTKKHKITKKHKKAKRDKKDNVKLPVAMFQPGKCEEFFIFKITSKQASTEIGWGRCIDRTPVWIMST